MYSNIFFVNSQFSKRLRLISSFKKEKLYTVRCEVMEYMKVNNFTNRQKYLMFGVLALVVVGMIFVIGCVRQQNSVTPDMTSGLKTCAELNGYECGVGDECQGDWLDASDTFSCCSELCESCIDEEDLLTIDLFEEITEDEDLGEIYE
jgi:hypothetical protein